MFGLLRMGFMSGSCVPDVIVHHHHPKMSRYQPIPAPPRKTSRIDTSLLPPCQEDPIQVVTYLAITNC